MSNLFIHKIAPNIFEVLNNAGVDRTLEDFENKKVDENIKNDG